MSGCVERLEHAGALEQEKELRRQRVARHVVVEAREERVLRGLLEQQSAPRRAAEAAREAGLAGADRALHHQVAGIFPCYPRKTKYTAPMMHSDAHR